MVWVQNGGHLLYFMIISFLFTLFIRIIYSYESPCLSNLVYRTIFCSVYIGVGVLCTISFLNKVLWVVYGFYVRLFRDCYAQDWLFVRVVVSSISRIIHMVHMDWNFEEGLLVGLF
ncbi:hypothetical protein KSS87_018845, partial [Heliosperma pusillum]